MGKEETIAPEVKSKSRGVRLQTLQNVQKENPIN